MTFSRQTPVATAIALAGATLLAAGCGSSSSDSDDPTRNSVVSRGTITGFGSIFVNGRKFETGGASISIDDAAGDESGLRLGMIVTVRGISDDGGRSWHAQRIDYDNELKGPIASITPDPTDPTRKTLVILGQSVIVDANTIFDDDGGLSFDTLAVGDVLEVSGHVTATELVATHVELQDNDDEIEIRGRIENLTATSFTIKGFTVNYDSTTELDDIAALAEGMLVEVEGRLNGSGDVLLADEIEAEDDDFGDDVDEIEIEGLISNFNSMDSTFNIGDQVVDYSAAVLFPSSLTLGDGLVVEVEGHIVGDVLFAKEVKQRGNKVEISAPLAVVNADSVGFSFDGGNVVAQVNRETELEDDTGMPIGALSDFNPGDFVELEAFRDGGGVLNAVEIERTDPDEIEIEAPVEAFDEFSRSVRLLGIDFDLSGARFEDHNDIDIDAQAFFAALEIGKFIEIEDADRNGVFDKAELED